MKETTNKDLASLSVDIGQNIALCLNVLALRIEKMPRSRTFSSRGYFLTVAAMALQPVIESLVRDLKPDKREEYLKMLCGDFRSVVAFAAKNKKRTKNDD